MCCVDGGRSVGGRLDIWGAVVFVGERRRRSVEIAEQSDRVADLASRALGRHCSLNAPLAAQSQPHDALLEDARLGR